MTEFYVAYEDRGPSRPCGQSVECTRHHKDLYVFDTYEGARAFITRIEEGLLSRVRPRITGFWSDEMNDVIRNFV